MLNASRVFGANLTSKRAVLHPQPEDAPYWYGLGPHLTYKYTT
jgi:hypothetical protein